MKKTNKLPNFLQSALWSYDISKMRLDNKSDKKEIITQVLNSGTDKQIEWLFKVYKPKEIRKILKNPRRGTWYPRSLNFWSKILEVKIPAKKYEQAILNINPKF